MGTENSDPQTDFVNFPIHELAAPQDLIFEKHPHPNLSTQTGVFIRNTNTSRGVVAAICVNTSQPLLLDTPDRLGHVMKWPLRFELRIAPGSLALAGFDTVPVWLALNENEVIKVQVTQSYTIEGAYYRDPPYHDNTDPKSLVWFYSVPISNGPGRFFDIAVNLHPNRQIKCDVEVLGSFPISFVVLPGYQQHINYGYDIGHFVLRKAFYI